MTGNELIVELQSLPPEKRALQCVHCHTEYMNREDSIGHEEVQDIDSVRVVKKDGEEKLQLGW